MTTFQTRQGTGTGRERPGEKVSRAEIFPAITFFLKIRSIICQIEEVGEGVKLFLKMEFLTDRIFCAFLTSSLIMTDLLRPSIKKTQPFQRPLCFPSSPPPAY